MGYGRGQVCLFVHNCGLRRDFVWFLDDLGAILGDLGAILDDLGTYFGDFGMGT